MKPTLQPRQLQLLLMGLLCLSTPISAQELVKYTGPFQLGNYIGEVDYTYRITEGDTLLQGAFSMKRSNVGALLDQKDDFFSFTGAFENGFPNGPWRFQFGEFESDKKTEVVGYQYRVNVNGTQHEASGNIKLGRPDGIWEISEKSIQDSEVKETLFSSKITYDNGVPQKSFRIENGQSTLVGRFLRNGLAHDSWTLFDNDFTETWSFSDGVLKEISQVKGGAARTLPVFDEPFRMSRTINLDERFSQILKLQLKSEDTEIVKGGIKKILAENADHYKKLDNLLDQLGKSEFMPMFKAKVPYFPLDSLEQIQLKSIQENYEHAAKVAEGLLENTQLNILKRSDTDAQFLYEVVERFNASFLRPLKKMTELQALGVLDFVERLQLFNQLFPKGNPSISLGLTQEDDGKSREYEGPSASSFDFTEDSLKSLAQMAEYAKLSLDDIASELYRKVKNEQQLQEFVVLEEQMIDQIDHLNQSLDTLGTLGNHTDVLQQLKTIAEEKLNKYSKLEASDIKLERAKQLVNCLETFETLAQTIGTLPEKKVEIQEIYQDAVWNPFMANLMNEDVKKRITAAYNNVLVPYILREAKKELTCEKAKKINQLLVQLHERMLQLREEDTVKLERKLRKEKDPETILHLFNLQTLEK